MTIDAGDIVTLVGPSGCGKSSLLDLLGGLAAPTSGEITLDGDPITRPGLDRGIVFQQYALLPWRSAQGNVELGLEAAGMGKRERRERSREVLARVGLERFRDHHPHELSGGMKQRVAIARSLAYEPEVLLMDEPYAALDAQTRELLQDELLDIWRRTGTTIVFITHDIDEAIHLGQRVAVMTAQPGRIKQTVEIDLPEPEPDVDSRSSPAFLHARHRVRELLHDEVVRAQQTAHDPAPDRYVDGVDFQ